MAATHHKLHLRFDDSCFNIFLARALISSKLAERFGAGVGFEPTRLKRWALLAKASNGLGPIQVQIPRDHNLNASEPIGFFPVSAIDLIGTSEVA